MSFKIITRGGSEVQRALYFFLGFARDAMQINHRGPDIRMTQERLDRAEVVARLQKMRGVTMAEGVSGNALCQLRFSDCFIQRILNMRVMKIWVWTPASHSATKNQLILYW